MYNTPENIKFGGGALDSSMHPVVMLLLLIGVVLMFVLPRRKLIVLQLTLTFLTPYGEQLNLGGAHFYLTRILIIFGLLRVWTVRTAEDRVPRPLNWVEKAFITAACLGAFSVMMLFLETQAFINQTGFLIDAVGGFFLYRYMVRDEEDVVRALKTLAVIVSVLGTTMLIEKRFEFNVFGFIGGRMYPFVREGALRAQGTFQGPIPCGTFGATSLALFLWLRNTGKANGAAIAGLIGAIAMVATSASSTPLLAFLATILGLMMWPVRGYMRYIRWGLAILALSVHLAMKAPVWFLINHVDLVAGNSGYHRAMLIDACVKHFGDWWLFGVKSTGNWGWDLWDQANQFVAVAENGGLLAFLFFMTLLSCAFSYIGTARKMVAGDKKQEWGFWMLGTSLFTHVVAFFGISYGDQTTAGWYLFLVAISATTMPVLRGLKASQAEPSSVVPADMAAGESQELGWAEVLKNAHVHADLKSWNSRLRSS
jgi:hypothetical protein